MRPRLYNGWERVRENSTRFNIFLAENIAGMRLKSYYAGLTKITDRSLEILGRMQSLESIEFYETKGVTDAGLVHLTGLRQLREVRLSGLPNVTFEGTRTFPAHVRVEYHV